MNFNLYLEEPEKLTKKKRRAPWNSPKISNMVKSDFIYNDGKPNEYF